MKVEVFGMLKAVNLEKILKEVESCSSFASKVVIYLKDDLSKIDRKYIKEGLEIYPRMPHSPYVARHKQDRAKIVHSSGSQAKVPLSPYSR